MPFTIHADPHTQVWRWRVWGFFVWTISILETAGLIYILGSLRCQSSGNPKDWLITLMSIEGSFFSSLITFFLRVFHKRLNSSPLMKHCKLTTVE